MFGTISSPHPDYAASCFSLFTFFGYVRWLNSSPQDQSGLPLSLLVILLACFAVWIKASQLPILLLVPAVLFRAYPSSLDLRTLSAFSVFILSFASLWLIHGIARSGCFLFPLEVTCLRNLPWTLDRPSVYASYIWNLSWARDPSRQPHEVLRDWAWLQPWTKNFLNFDMVQRSLILVGFSALIGSVSKIWKTKSSKQTPQLFVFPWLGFFILIAALVFSFFTAPDLRFSYGFLLLFVHLIIFNHLRALQYSRIFRLPYAFILGFLSIILVLGNLLERGPIGRLGHQDSLLWGKLDLPKVHSKLIQNQAQQTIFVPKDQQCWFETIPCVPIPNPSVIQHPVAGHWIFVKVGL